MHNLQTIFTSRLLKPVGVFGLMGAMALGLSACSSAKSALGLSKSAPDEFAVVTKAPLIVPPDFSLRPPKPGAPRPQELQPTQSARAALLGKQGISDAAPSTGETALLQNAGAGQVDPNIRAVLNEESGRLRQKEEGFADKVLFWQGDEVKPSAPEVVDATNESDRLKQNKAEGKSPNEGTTPSIKKEEGFFGKIKGIF